MGEKIEFKYKENSIEIEEFNGSQEHLDEFYSMYLEKHVQVYGERTDRRKESILEQTKIEEGTIHLIKLRGKYIGTFIIGEEKYVGALEKARKVYNNYIDIQYEHYAKIIYDKVKEKYNTNLLFKIGFSDYNMRKHAADLQKRYKEIGAELMGIEYIY